MILLYGWKFFLKVCALIGYFEVTWHQTIKLFPANIATTTGNLCHGVLAHFVVIANYASLCAMEVKVNEEITCKRKKLSFFSQQIYFSRGGKHRVVTILMKKTGYFGWKIKWFAPFRLGSFRNMGCDFRRCNFATLFSLFSWFGKYFVAGCAPTTSNFTLLCLSKGFPPGCFV